MTSIEEKQNPLDHYDVVPELQQKDGVDRHLAVQLPEVLRDLSPEELAAIDKSATRKLDILLMPTLMVLYILSEPVFPRS